MDTEVADLLTSECSHSLKSKWILNGTKKKLYGNSGDAITTMAVAQKVFCIKCGWSIICTSLTDKDITELKKIIDKGNEE